MTKPRPTTRQAALQNRAFLRILARTGNVRLAAREVGVAHSTLLTRRARQAGFALRWEAALAVAGAALDKQRETSRSESVTSKLASLARPSSRRADMPPSMSERLLAVSRHHDAPPDQVRGPLTLCSAARTSGGEVAYVRLKSGRWQVRRAQAGRLTRAAEQAFLAALSATCNVTLAAAAVGASPRAFYRRKRMDPAFAREYREALRRGYERIELALLEAGLAGAYEHDDWRRNDPPAMPPMSVNQGLQLMYLHQKEARLQAEAWPIKKLRGETTAMHCLRLQVMAEVEARRRRDEFEIGEAERWAEGLPPWGPAGEAVRRELGLVLRQAQDDRFELPDLAQVTGWSRAKAIVGSPHPTQPGEQARQEPDTALFGGWRIDEMEARLDGEGSEEEGPSCE